ncbi:MAG: glycine/sarcosine/betaine reductase selenoprotein B family protein [Desulfobulbia bacterium]
MVHLRDFPEKARDALVNQDLPEYKQTDCVSGPPIRERRIALITTAGIHRRDDKVFSPGIGEYRIIPDDTEMNDLIMSHVSTNFDRTGFHLDVNLVFPIDRLRELDDQGEIGSTAKFHYAFMGATPPTAQEAVSKDVAQLLKQDNVDGVLLAGV